MKKYVHTLMLAMIGILLSSCWIEPVDNDDDPDNGSPTSVYKEESNNRLPSGATSASTPKIIAIDLNNDDALDLVVAQENSSNKLLINNGDGNFEDETQQRLPFQLQLLTKDVVVAYLNNDDALDLLFVNENRQQNELYINNQNGTFSDAAGRIPIQGDFNGVDSADIENDGDPDLLIGNLGQNGLLLNNGNGNFADESFDQLPSESNNSRDVAFIDLDGDGDFDIVEGNDTENRILINDGNGFFEDESARRLPSTNSEEQTHTIQTADVNGNGHLDLFFGNVATSSSQADPHDRLLINNGDGEFTDVTADRLPDYEFNTIGATFHDLNSDGYPDLLVGDIEGGFRIFINDGNGSFTDESDDWLPEDYRPEVLDIKVADLTGDNLDDIYIGIYQNEDQLLIRQQEN